MLKGHLDSLSIEEQSQVQKCESTTVFTFGGGSHLESQGKWTLPCVIAGASCKVVTDLVKSDIPLLLSKDSMKRAQVKLDLENDRAKILGKEVDLQFTSSGHYCVPIQQQEVIFSPDFSALTTSTGENRATKIKTVEKLHKQFAHPSSHR